MEAQGVYVGLRIMHNQFVTDRLSMMLRATDVFIVTCRGNDSINITRYVLLLGSDVYVCYRNSLTHSGHKDRVKTYKEISGTSKCYFYSPCKFLIADTTIG